MVSAVQQSVFQSYNGVTLSGMFPQFLNGTYVQMIERIKVVATTNTVRFFTGTHNAYLRTDGTYYYLLVYVEPTTNKIFNDISLTNPAWLILRYTINPEQISNNTDHYALLSEEAPVQAFISYETSRFGSQNYPQTLNAEFF